MFLILYKCGFANKFLMELDNKQIILNTDINRI